MFDDIVKTFPNKISSNFKPRHKNESKFLKILKMWAANHFHKQGYKIQFNYSIQKYFFASIMATRGDIKHCIEFLATVYPKADYPNSLTNRVAKILRQRCKFEVTLVVPEVIYISDAEEDRKDIMRIEQLPQILEYYDINLLIAPYNSPEKYKIPLRIKTIE